MTSNIRASGCAVILPPPHIHRSSAIWLNGLGANGHALLPMVSALGLPDNHGYKFVFPHASLQPINGFRWLGAKQNSGLRAPETLVRDLMQIGLDTRIPKNRIVHGGLSQDGAMTLYAGLRYPKQADDAPLSTCTPLLELVSHTADSSGDDSPTSINGSAGDPILALSLSSHSTHLLRALGYAVDAHESTHRHEIGLEEIQAINTWLREIMPLPNRDSILRRTADFSRRALLGRLTRRPAEYAYQQ